LCRASTSWRQISKKDVDGRDQPGHDENFPVFRMSLKMLAVFWVTLFTLVERLDHLNVLALDAEERR
jgi:hypothetical protein